jgi:ATPase family associated with various cellular activities (AAA)
MIETTRAAVVPQKAWQRLSAGCDWDHLVLPAREDDQLRAVAAEFSARFRNASGAQPNRPARGRRGILVLFWGPAGTGKTMAAQTLAHELRLGVIEADLTSVLVRERWRMARLFAIADRSGAVLVFDHFETLTSGATDVHGSDLVATANSLSDLLERSAGHPGIVIFATRLRPVADEPVLGQFDEVIEFRLPGRAAREEIWRHQLAKTPLGETDIPAVASALTMSGGEIAARCAAAKQSAARADVPVRIDHVVSALERNCATEPVKDSGQETLELLRARMTSPAREAPDRDPPGVDAQAKPTSPASTTPTVPSLATPAEIAASGPAPGPSRFSMGDALAGVSRGRRWVIAGFVGIVVASALGLVLRGSNTETTALPALDRQAAVGPVIVWYPSSWQKRAGASLPGLPKGHAVAFSPGESRQGLLMVGTSAAVGATLLPHRLVTAVGDHAGEQAVRLGSMWFYRFVDLSPRGDRRPASVYALPTSAGLVMSVCRPPGNGFTATCERILGALTLRPGVRALASSPEYARSLSDVIAQLNAVRLSRSWRLAAARTAAAQSRVEDQLANADAQAASAVANLKAGPAQAANAALASALKMTAGAYAAMAQAASQGDAAAYQAANTSLAAASAATGSAFADLEQFGYNVG